MAGLAGAQVNVQVLDEETLKSKEQVKLNTIGRYPLLQGKTGAITGTWAICQYICQQTRKLNGESALDEAKINQWIGWNQTQLQPAVQTPADDQANQIKALFKSLNSSLSSTKYVAGKSLTYADVLLAITITESVQHLDAKQHAKTIDWLKEVYG